MRRIFCNIHVIYVISIIITNEEYAALFQDQTHEETITIGLFYEHFVNYTPI